MRIELEIVSDEVVKYLKEKCVDDTAIRHEINELLYFSVSIMNRAKASKDIDFVKKEVDSMIARIDKTIDSFENALNKSVDDVLNTALNIDVDSSLMGKTKVWLRTQLSDIRDNVEKSIKLITDNATKVSNDKLSTIEKGIADANKNFNPALETSYLGVMKKTVVQVNEAINKLLDPTNTEGFTFQLNQNIATYFGKDSPLLVIVQSIFNAQQKEFSEQLTKLREEIAQRIGISDTMEKTAVKGFSFEDQCEDELAECASMFGDVCTRVSKTEVSTRSKKGDFIYEFTESPKLVIECKDEEVGHKPMLKYLDEAMEARGCEFSILCTKRADQLPNTVGLFNLYEGNKLFCSFDMLFYAIRWARLYLTRMKSESVEGIDTKEILDIVETIRTILKNVTNVKSKLTVMRKAVNGTSDEVVDLVELMKGNIENALFQIERELK